MTPADSPAYARILAALGKHGGLTLQEIARAAHVGVTTLSGGGYLQRLRRERIIFISGWRRAASGAFSIPQFSLGDGPDFPRPKVDAKNRAAPGMLRLVAVIEQHGPLDYRQAAALAGLSPHTVKNAGYIEALLQQRHIHVCGWLRSQSGPARALFAAGDGADVPCPTPLTPGEKSRAYRRRRLAASAATNFAAQLRLLVG
ncbi:MAG: winged helix-turn-helix domain-containing protein [Rhodocyclaceae bacterium]|nr:winged helix-turn-helix domain-containing protein [Rhodocyclaceae bacterium]